MRARFAVRSSDAVDASSKLDELARLHPSVKLPPDMGRRDVPNQQHAGREYGFLSGDSKQIFPFHGYKMTQTSTYCNVSAAYLGTREIRRVPSCMSRSPTEIAAQRFEKHAAVEHNSRRFGGMAERSKAVVLKTTVR